MTDTVASTHPRALPLMAGIVVFVAVWAAAGVALWYAEVLSELAARLAGLVFFILQVPLLVLAHELGHYSMARLVGWRVPIFVWGSLVVRLTPFRIANGASPFGNKVSGAIVAVPPAGKANRRDWIAITAAGPCASLSCGVLGVVLTVLAQGHFAHGHFNAEAAFALFAVLGFADGIINILPILRGSDGRQIVALLHGIDVERSARYARMSEQEINGVRPRDWPQDLVTALRIENMWSGSADAALYVYAVDMDGGAIASARAALDLAGQQNAVLAEKAFVAAFIDHDAAAARAVFRQIPAHQMQHTLGYWRAAAAVAVAERDAAAAREAIRKGRLVCESSAYATPFDRDHFDALERRLENLR